MQVLKNRIDVEGRALPGGILKVDGFINHRIDAALMHDCGVALAHHFRSLKPQLILTAEISGIGPGLMTAAQLGCSVVYARKKQPVTMPNNCYRSSAPSHTKGEMQHLLVSAEFLKASEKVLIIDDFLASGKTILALADLCRQANAPLIGIGTLIEKTFENGRQLLEPLGVPVHSLAKITHLSEGSIGIAA